MLLHKALTFTKSSPVASTVCSSMLDSERILTSKPLLSIKARSSGYLTAKFTRKSIN